MAEHHFWPQGLLLDADLQQAALMGLVYRMVDGEDGEAVEQPVLLVIRLKLEGGEISEAEHLIAGVRPDNMDHLQTPRSGLSEGLQKTVVCLTLNWVRLV